MKSYCVTCDIQSDHSIDLFLSRFPDTIFKKLLVSRHKQRHSSSINFLVIADDKRPQNFQHLHARVSVLQKDVFMLFNDTKNN